jgi:hypothetical protein
MVTKTFEITEKQDTLLQKILALRGLTEKQVIEEQFAFHFKTMIESEYADLTGITSEVTEGLTDSEKVTVLAAAAEARETILLSR